MKILSSHRFWIVLAALLPVACSPWERVSHDFPARVGADVDHGRWTRDARLYSDLETVGMWSVTLLSDRFLEQLEQLVVREAPGREPGDIVGFALPQTQATALIVLSSPDRRWRQLQPPRSPWAINILVEGRFIAPVHIRRLSPPAAFERYFPAWNPWSTAWLVSYPLPVSTFDQQLQIQIAAPGGKRAGLAWP